MKKVITYGTYDLLHIGHIRLLERAKALGDYLIVGVTADDFDKKRGKINVRQSLMERVEAVRETGLADEIIIEEYEGQKIDDIKKYDVDIFTVGSDWVGKFDYLKEYCEVVYLERTKGISSSDIRDNENKLRVGIVGGNNLAFKYFNECGYVNGIQVVGVRTSNPDILPEEMRSLRLYKNDNELIEDTDAVFVFTNPSAHFEIIKKCLENGRHVLCEAPVCVSEDEINELFEIARENGCELFDSVKTAYATAYDRALLLLKGGKIGDIVSVSTTCTSLKESQMSPESVKYKKWKSICAWGPTALLPIFQLLGTDYKSATMISKLNAKDKEFDDFSKIDFLYDSAVATAFVGKGVKSEGEMVVSGTKGYLYIPSPWWKTDYFEIRYENPADNKRYFYQLDGEGIRNEIVLFTQSIQSGKSLSKITPRESAAIVSFAQRFYDRRDITIIDN